MSRVPRTGLTGLPLTSNGHRLCFSLERPGGDHADVAATCPLTLPPSPVAADDRCRCPCLLSLIAVPAAVARALVSQ